MGKNHKRNNFSSQKIPKSMAPASKDESYVLLDWESSNIDSTSDQDDDHLTSHANLMMDFNLNKDGKNNQKMTTRQFEKKVLARFKNYEQQRIEKMMCLKEERYLEECKELTLIPKIQNDKNQNDKELIGKKHENLVDRLDKIIENKKQALEKERNKQLLTQEKEELRECSFTPNINREGPRRNINDLFQWQKTRQDRRFNKSQNDCNENKDLSFKPSISKKSIKLLKQNGISDSKSKKVEDRLLEYLKKKNKLDDENESCFSNIKCEKLIKNTSHKSLLNNTNQKATKRMMSAKNLHV